MATEKTQSVWGGGVGGAKGFGKGSDRRFEGSQGARAVSDISDPIPHLSVGNMSAL